MDSVLKQLQQVGYKTTLPRREILSILNSTPTSAQGIFEILKQKQIKTDLVTIYRTLDLFTKLGFVRKTQFGDKIARFEFVASENHHHHLVCENCGDISDIPLDEKSLIKQVEQKSKFKVSRHSLEFFGVCQKCQLK